MNTEFPQGLPFLDLSDVLGSIGQGGIILSGDKTKNRSRPVPSSHPPLWPAWAPRIREPESHPSKSFVCDRLLLLLLFISLFEQPLHQRLRVFFFNPYSRYITHNTASLVRSFLGKEGFGEKGSS
jgi:hypothetical protein